MLRLFFEKTGNAVWMSHLDLMRLFQRAFQRAGLSLTHTQGFNPRASVSIALPLSVGVESTCELLDFELEDGNVSCEDIRCRLNAALVPGVRVLDVYSNGRKLKELSFLHCLVSLEYDNGISADAQRQIEELFRRKSLLVMKKSKNGEQEQDIIPMIQSIEVSCVGDQELQLSAVVCCQNPSLNPMQLVVAIDKYLPDSKANFAKCRRVEIYDSHQTVFR